HRGFRARVTGHVLGIRWLHPHTSSPASNGRVKAMTPNADTWMVNRQVMLLTRDGCSICEKARRRLAELAAELGFELSTTHVDAEAAAGNPALRAEFGDRLPVVLLDGREHSYWQVDEPRLRADLTGR